MAALQFKRLAITLRELRVRHGMGETGKCSLRGVMTAQQVKTRAIIDSSLTHLSSIPRTHIKGEN